MESCSAECPPPGAAAARVLKSIIDRRFFAMLDIKVNGAQRRFESELNLSDLLDRLGLAGKKVAVERNGEIVPRSRYAATPIASGDRLEIVVAVGGG